VPLPGVGGSKVELGDVFDDLDQFVELVALLAGKGDEFLRSLDAAFVLTPRTAARSRAGGSRSPGFASPSAIARRISAATWSWRSTGSSRFTWTRSMVLVIVASIRKAASPRLPPHLGACLVSRRTLDRVRTHGGHRPDHDRARLPARLRGR
jgi:hypothetical protein